MKTNFLFLILIIFASCSQNKIESSRFKIPVLGQTAPPDMLHVPGNDTFPAFYISKIEEPNINYLTYLIYLQVVYGESYPEYVEEAIPQKPKGKRKHYYNDPYLESYLSHPAFAYYPVTNLTFEQIENYLSWKTDRLNESILMKTGIYNPNFEQKDEDSFNTEAYLNGQYQGDVRKNLKSGFGGERPAGLSDGILFTGFRLPTEAEWDYLSRSKFNKPSKSKGTFHNHPFGDDYYPLKWIRAYGRRNGDYSRKTISEDLLSFNLKQVEIPQKAQMQELSQAFNYLQYDHSDLDILYNLEGGVKEWTLDVFEEEPNPDDLTWINVLEKVGCNINNAIKDKDGLYVEKTFNGKMKYFRYIGIDANGEGREIEPYGMFENYIQAMEKEQTLLELKIQKYPLQKTSAALDSAYIKRIENRKKELLEILNSDKVLSAYELDRFKKEMDDLKYKSSPEFAYYGFRTYKNITLEDLKKQLAEKKKSIELLKIKKQNFNNQNRVVKGGDWKNPTKDRYSFPVDSAAIDIGFRCILPYTGTPVLKKYKVKWRQAPLDQKF